MYTTECLSYYSISEETKFFTQELPIEERELIKGDFKRYMDNSFIFWPKHLHFEYFSTRLSNLHPAVKYTFEMAKLIQSDRSQSYQAFKFLDIEVNLHSDNTVESDIYYRDTNAHDYLPYNCAHPKHCKDNLPDNSAERIIVFVSNDEKVEMRLKNLKSWLKDCNHPDKVIIQSFYNAKLRDPAPFADSSKNIPSVTTYYGNIDNKNSS